MRALTLHQPWAQLMVWGLKNIETRSWPAPSNIIGQRIAIHAGKRKPRPTEWNIEMQRAVLQRAGGSRSMPMGAVVATAKLIECMQVMSDPESSGLVICRGFGEIGEGTEYEATIATDPYGDFSVGRWLWVFQDLHRVKLISINGRQGGRTLPTWIAAEFSSGWSDPPHSHYVQWFGSDGSARSAEKETAGDYAGRLSAGRVGIACFNCGKTAYDSKFMCPGCGHSAEAGVNEEAGLARGGECSRYWEASDHDVDSPYYVRHVARGWGIELSCNSLATLELYLCSVSRGFVENVIHDRDLHTPCGPVGLIPLPHRGRPDGVSTRMCAKA